MRTPTRLPAVPDEIIEAFRSVAPTVEAFARENDLLIERYRRGKGAWELQQERQTGGQATLTLSYRERTGHVLDLSAVWWVDDRKARTRRLRADKIGVYERRDTPRALRQLLESGLARIDSWTDADLGPPRGPFNDPAAEQGDSGPAAGQ